MGTCVNCAANNSATSHGANGCPSCHETTVAVAVSVIVTVAVIVAVIVTVAVSVTVSVTVTVTVEVTSIVTSDWTPVGCRPVPVRVL